MGERAGSGIAFAHGRRTRYRRRPTEVCLERDEFEAWSVAGADLRLGTAAGFFLDAGHVISALGVVPQPCHPAGLAASPGSACTVHLDGMHALRLECWLGIVMGTSFVRAEVPAARMGALLTAVSVGGVARLEGGTLTVDVDEALSVAIGVEGHVRSPWPFEGVLAAAERGTLVD